MNEHDVIRFMRRFPDKITTEKELKSKKWMCSTCQMVYEGEDMRPPAPCKACGGVFFVKLCDLYQENGLSHVRR